MCFQSVLALLFVLRDENARNETIQMIAAVVATITERHTQI
jgi:hypothetical protein